MSAPYENDFRVDQAAISDESLLAVHEKLLGRQPDEKARYRMMPLGLLFFYSGLIFFGGTYIGRYSGRFDAHIYNENLRYRGKGEAMAAVADDPVKLGEKLFNGAACNTCHQPTGIGVPGAIPPLAGSEWAVGSDERNVRIVLYGLLGPIKVKGADYNSAMPGFGQRIPATSYNWDDKKIAAVLTYVRQAWGNQAEPITPEKVAEIHNKDGSRGPLTAAELEKLP